MNQFKTAIVGGTFDIIHKGHVALFCTAFDIARTVIIGLTSDEFAASHGKKPQGYDMRHGKLEKYIESNHPTRKYEIHKLDDNYGPIALGSQVDVLVLSDETKSKAIELNLKRKKLGVAQVDVIIVPMVLAEDKSRISNTRMRLGIIDSKGHVL